ncbi:MAG: protoheme IX farnesyltransferase [Ignavibacteriae bacterium]|nr:protoheme IX farnesyltransferase [Ignavibacteriota bacterium]
MNTQANVLSQPMTRTRSRFLDYIELMKPELTFLSVLTTLCGFYLATQGEMDWWLFINVAIGTTLVGGGAGALNQYIERAYDAMMKRTERRPLPAGRLFPIEVLVFGVLISVFGILQLTILVNVLTGFLAFLTWSSYLFLYTPLKRISPISTLIGGIPGALPPMMGWTAVRNEITIEAWVLFAILFFWQMPHFFSLAWMYRKDYAKAGFKILSVVDESGKRTSRQIFAYLLALIPASIAPTVIGMTGSLSVISALFLGFGFLIFGVALMKFSRQHSGDSLSKVNYYSRKLFFASLVYLPVLMIMLSLDKL